MDKDKYFCQNEECKFYRLKNKGNIRIKQYQGKKDRIALLECKECKRTFSERRGTAMFRIHHPLDIVALILRLYLSSMSLNDIERITGVTKKTVISWIRKMGKHIHLVTDKYLYGIDPKECQIDEMWSFVMIKRKTAKRKNIKSKYLGDEWIYLAIDPISKVLIHWHIGKRNYDNAELFLIGVYAKLGKYLPLITSDEYKVYKEILLELYGIEVPSEYSKKSGMPSKKPKIKSNKELKYARVKKTRKKGRVIKIVTDIVAGDKEEILNIINKSTVSKKINTSIIERFNGTVRHCLRRFSRQTYCFSKKLDMMKCTLDLFIGYYNFVKIHQTLNMSPLCYKGIISNSWTIKELLTYRI